MSDRKTRANEAFDLLKQGKDEEARLILENIVRDDAADAAVLETLGDVREKLGDKTGAMDAYASALVHLRARAEHKKALSVIELMQLVDDRAVLPHTEAADIKRELGDEQGCWSEVAIACELALAQHDVELASGLVEEYEDLLAEAPPALHIARHLEHVHREACVRMCERLGHALMRRNKLDDALALFAYALDLEPRSRELLHARAQALLNAGRFIEARVVAERALALDGADLIALGLLESAARSAGDEAGARAARERFDKMTRSIHERDEDPSDLERP